MPTKKKTPPPPPAVSLSNEEKKLLGEYARRVWDEIGYDVLTCEMEQPIRERDVKAIPRDHVIEVVCDAGRLDEAVESAVKRARHQATQLAMLERLHAYMESNPRDLEKILKPAFPHERYGL